uniref:Uncharacterized protein n=1 Tax=Oryza sativa subsp. japonica TaxID=39947 RepID=Q6K5C4_ORYSJ|nr:hypothetical protein [Oryza sativa Japonica Group]
MACDQKGGLHGKELTPEGDFLVAFLRVASKSTKGIRAALALARTYQSRSEAL